jgi:methyl-accepting chemotaxis protein
MIANPHIDAIWDSWELSHLDPTWDKPYGRWLHIFYRVDGKLLSKYEKRSMNGDPAVYATLRTAGKEALVEPYLSDLQQGGLMTSLTSPLYIGGEYIGLVGIDLFLGRFQDLVSSINPYEESEAFLLSNQGTFIAHPDTSIFSKKIEEVFPELNASQHILDRIKRGEKFSFVHKNLSGENLFYSFSPIQVGKTQTPWSFGIVVPERVILQEANQNYNIGILVGVFGVLLFVIIIFVLANNITRPIKLITNLLVDLSRGKIDKSMHVTLKTEDEIAEMSNALSSSIDGLLAKTEFAKSIGVGVLDSELELLSEDDVLGKSLIEMRESLKKAEDEEKKRKVEDEKRRWVNEGLAKFGDILRQNNDNLSKLGDELIKNLVWYLNASLGGIFVKNEENNPVTFDLASAFAYDRKRYLQKSFEVGEGLIGTCAAEMHAIFLSEIPQKYIEITSGLGDTNPNTLLLIPLIIEEEVLGVIELASLNRFADFEIEFVEKLGQSIASTLRTVKINQKTAELLRKSQEQTEIMVSQEEEMRQNLEELQATQEEAARKTIEMEGLIDALNASSYVMEYDSQGNVININEAYLDLLNIRRDDAIGKHHSENLVMTDHQRMTYEEFWSNLRKGIIQKQTMRINIKEKDFSFLETYTPIRDANGDVYKVLKVAIDISMTSK